MPARGGNVSQAFWIRDRLDRSLNAFGKALGSEQDEAGAHQLGDFIPIDRARIKAKCDPTSRPDIGGQVKPPRLRRHQSGVIAGQHLASDAHNTVAMMIVQEICKRPLAYKKRSMISVASPASFRQRFRNLSQPDQPGIFARTLSHESQLTVYLDAAGQIRLRRMERDKGIEPSPRPWQGRVLPLYESRSGKSIYSMWKEEQQGNGIM